MNNLYYMKRNFIIILFLFFVSHSFAQQSPPQRFSPKEFMKDMENFISQEAGLTPMEAASFFLFLKKCALSREPFLTE